MKGVVEIEFIISVFVFVTTISFVTLLIVNNIPAIHNTAAAESIKSRSYQYAEMLLFDEGYPRNWEAGLFNDTKRIGFSSGKRYLIDQSKMDQLAAFCSSEGYDKIKDIFGVSFSHDIVVEATKLDGTPITGGSTVLCGPAVATTLRPQFNSVRLGILPTGQVARIKVTIIA